MKNPRISQKGLHLEVTRMYRKTNPNQMVFDFHIPFGGKLRCDNRWVILSQQIPWDQIESQYAGLFEESHLGCPAKSSRVALGALIIKERLQTTDRETVEQIRENPYLQYFLGSPGYTDKEPFHHTSMVHFRKRFDQEILAQRLWMYQNKCHRIENRIVSLYQPHVRPIVRGKAHAPVEFGAKVSISLVDGFSFVDVLSWDAYNESGDLEGQIESYRARYGFYPESAHADKIYRTRDNRRYCKEHGIRLSGPALGRPKQLTESNKEELQAIKRQQRQDEIDRIAVEGKFGQGKRRFTLNRIMAKLAETSEAVIMVSFIVMNLEKILSSILLCLLGVWYDIRHLLRAMVWSCHEELRMQIEIASCPIHCEGYCLK